jgi:hypothetical protein
VKARHFVRADAERGPSAIAVPAENAQAGWKARHAELLVEVVSRSVIADQRQPMGRAIVVGVVYGEEPQLGFPAAGAHTAVGINNPSALAATPITSDQSAGASIGGCTRRRHATLATTPGSASSAG